MAGNAVRLKTPVPVKQTGEVARLKVSQGADQGVVYILRSPSVSIGRGETCDVILSDLKASRHHATLTRHDGKWAIQDMGSANGLEVNGQLTREASLHSGDRVVLGETAFEFVSGDAPLQLLASAPRSLQEVSHQKGTLQQNEIRLKAMTSLGGFDLPGNLAGTHDDGKKGWVYRFSLVALAVVIGMILLQDFEKQASLKEAVGVSGSGSDVNLSIFLPKVPTSTEYNKNVDKFFKEGLREYKEKNYIRAKRRFKDALIMTGSSHELSRMYIENCNREIRKEIQRRLLISQENLKVGAYAEAKVHCQAILRLWDEDLKNPDGKVLRSDGFSESAPKQAEECLAEIRKKEMGRG